MYITKLIITNFRGFTEGASLCFAENKPSVIIGINGSGKTTILDSLAILLQVIIRPFVHFEPSGRIEFSQKDISIGSSKSKLDALLRFKIESNEKSIDLRVSSNLETSAQRQDNYRELRYLTDYIKSAISSKNEKEIPIMCYYQTNRNFSGNGLQKYTITSSPQSRRDQAYVNAFNPQIDYNAILSWYLEQVNIQNQEKVSRNDLKYELPTIKEITNGLKIFLSKLEGSSMVNVSTGISKYNDSQVLIIKKDQVELEFSQLSAGEKMVIGLVLDIAYRMAIGNPMMQNPLLSSGIVLIDELELHLHPNWQISILNALSSTFPNVQFIVTTHSPLIINHIKNDQLILLDNQTITQGSEIHNIYGKAVNAIIEDIMGTTERPKEIKKVIGEIEKILDDEKPDTKLARKKLNDLRKKIDPNDDEILKLDTLITIEEADEVDN